MRAPLSRLSKLGSGLIQFGTVALVVFLSTSETKAATGDNIGINSARRIAESVEYTVRELEVMQERFKVDLSLTINSLREMQKQAFDRIDSISADRVQEVTRLTNETVAKIQQMETEAFDRTNNLVSCTPQIMANAVEESLSNIRFWKFVINYKSREELSPSNQYIAARNEIINSLRTIPNTANAEGVLAAYGEISRLAILAQCHYKTEPIGTELLIQSRYYSQLATPWGAILRRK
jgi:hypothetical protein